MEGFEIERKYLISMPDADYLRQNRCTVALKAVLTQTNAGWSSQRLHRELAAEHEAMRNAAKSVHSK